MLKRRHEVAWRKRSIASSSARFLSLAKVIGLMRNSASSSAERM